MDTTNNKPSAIKIWRVSVTKTKSYESNISMRSVSDS